MRNAVRRGFVSALAMTLAACAGGRASVPLPIADPQSMARAEAFLSAIRNRDENR